MIFDSPEQKKLVYDMIRQTPIQATVEQLTNGLYEEIRGLMAAVVGGDVMDATDQKVLATDHIFVPEDK